MCSGLRPVGLPLVSFLEHCASCGLISERTFISQRMCKFAYMHARMYRIEDLVSKDIVTQMVLSSAHLPVARFRRLRGNPLY
jgi:hypothetical protein